MGCGRHEYRLVFVMVASLVIWAIATCKTLLPSVVVSFVPFFFSFFLLVLNDDL
ncbi:hypothetical protein EV401DRAFT_2245012 [Pisolithus croceorrhizus]|nr:hypothetical protein EV401DRAFT_2245012 [Pisolithus croceorrhizus]